MKFPVLLLFFCLAMSPVSEPLAQPSSQAGIADEQRSEPLMTEEEKIHHLINYVRHLEGSTFIRNGKEFTPDKAADHLNSKYEKHKKKIKSAHDFVDRLASFSKTKEPYQIRLSNGETIKCGDLLNKELTRIES